MYKIKEYKEDLINIPRLHQISTFLLLLAPLVKDLEKKKNTNFSPF